MPIALLFPGQASQFPGMGKELHDAYACARAVFEEVSDALSKDIAALCFRGSDEQLRQTENTQPAIFTVSVAAFRALSEETALSPVCGAGHSLGEYSALVAAGVLPLRDAARILQSRGRYMQDAVPAGEGAMAAILGLSRDKVEEACRTGSAQGVVSPANFNGGDQIVISGAAKAVAAACDAAREAGAKRAVPLAVSAPFHCALMEPAAERLAAELRAVPQGLFRFPVVANLTAMPYAGAEPVAETLRRQITAPVLWDESVRAMCGMGATSFVEVGPGKVLAGLVRRIAKDAAAATFCGPADAEAVRGLAR
jgi:[acyl-carrier-protein] S-malonyltransferase